MVKQFFNKMFYTDYWLTASSFIVLLVNEGLFEWNILNLYPLKKYVNN